MPALFRCFLFHLGALSQEAILVWMQSCSVFRLLLILSLSLCHFFFTCSYDGYELYVYKPLWIGAAEACFSLFSSSPLPALSWSALHWSYCSSSITTPFSFMWFVFTLSVVHKFPVLFLWYYCFERCKCCKNMYIIFRVVWKALCDDESAMFLCSSWSVCSPFGLALRGCVRLSPWTNLYNTVVAMTYMFGILKFELLLKDFIKCLFTFSSFSFQ